jgi:hypothetical protein
MRACAKRKGVETCAQCERFPCIRYRLFRVVSWLLSIEKKLPHQKVRMGNLARIGCIGTDAWLQEQGQRWACPECATPFSWYAKNCSQCGREVESLKDFK